ncbi:hypothetical protein COLO4_38365 [Corchorus olitorius]|uniref:Uncharacterized protein n=1 Tax=Corchorus olitorius TaxID=93759 RepID=A0A1R3FVD5_9ROSI|nr:hypothetical protein COLO4_38365 [Corchorus olitorius]
MFMFPNEIMGRTSIQEWAALGSAANYDGNLTFRVPDISTSCLDHSNQSYYKVPLMVSATFHDYLAEL